MKKQASAKKILPFGDPNLRAECKKVEVYHSGLGKKIDSIAKTLVENQGGAALAAPQVGLLKRIIVIDYLSEYFELVNPIIVESSGEVTDAEGCLSLPGYWGNVTRAQRVVVKYNDRVGFSHTVEVADEIARCFQHEIDHLDGILYIDRMTEGYVNHERTNKQLAVETLRELTKQRFCK